MYCQEPSPVCKQLWSHLSIITTCLLRVFLFSILFKLSPLISCSILFLIYSIAALLYRYPPPSCPSSLNSKLFNTITAPLFSCSIIKTCMQTYYSLSIRFLFVLVFDSFLIRFLFFLILFSVFLNILSLRVKTRQSVIND